jgi:hypothetical protein
MKMSYEVISGKSIEILLVERQKTKNRLQQNRAIKMDKL